MHVHIAGLAASRFVSARMWTCRTLLVANLLMPVCLCQQPSLIPQPREIENLGTPFRILPTTQIVVATSAESDHFAALTLQQEIKAAIGKVVPIVSTVRNSDSSIVLGRFENPRIRDLVARNGMRTNGIGSEGYALDVRPDQVLVAGMDTAGLFYGVQTLRQLVMPEDHYGHIPGVRIRDWPSLRFRGTQVDLSRGPVPKLDYLKRIVRTIAEFKMNQLNLYMEDALPIPGQPLMGSLDDTLSEHDFRDLVAYALPYHVDIVPATEGCGHLHKLLRFEQYSPMAERPHGFDLAANDETAADFLSQFYSQVHSVFPSDFYHIGCDETHELGTGRSASLVEKEGYAAAYAMSVRRAYNAVRRYNKQVIFWGDMAVAHPEVLPLLPKDIIAATWEYFPHSSYDNWIKPFSDARLRMIVCPWVGNTSLIIPNYEVAAFNIANFTEAGKMAGAIGVNVTVWNDDGETLFAPNWWSILYGAANAWEASPVKISDFDEKYDWAFYRNTDHRFVQALKSLSNINSLLHQRGINYVYSSDFGGTNDRLFWRDPFSLDGQGDATKLLPIASEIRRISENSFDLFATSENRARRNADTLKYFEFAALKLDALGLRYQALGDISEKYKAILDKQTTLTSAEIDAALFQIQGVNGPLLDLRDYTTKLRAMYHTLWLDENLGSWLPNVLQLYDHNSADWQNEIARFESVKSNHREGKALPSAQSLGLLEMGTSLTSEAH